MFKRFNKRFIVIVSVTVFFALAVAGGVTGGLLSDDTGKNKVYAYGEDNPYNHIYDDVNNLYFAWSHVGQNVQILDNLEINKIQKLPNWDKTFTLYDDGTVPIIVADKVHGMNNHLDLTSTNLSSLADKIKSGEIDTIRYIGDPKLAPQYAEALGCNVIAADKFTTINNDGQVITTQDGKPAIPPTKEGALQNSDVKKHAPTSKEPPPTPAEQQQALQESTLPNLKDSDGKEIPRGIDQNPTTKDPVTGEEKKQNPNFPEVDATSPTLFGNAIFGMGTDPTKGYKSMK